MITLASDLPLLLPITALLPLTAILLVAQSNPYQTLVLRGILGAVAALVYALLGAADVALTEALVGTLLSTTLYAVALRSSMVLRLGCADPQEVPAALKTQLARWLEPASLRLELVSQGPAAQDLHGLLEWQGAAQPPRVWLHNGGLRRRLGELLAAAAWQPELLPLERIEPEQIQPERTGSDPASGSEHAREVGR
jgi:putative multicomponent Na+:H+ antiporter subunit B